MADTKKKCFVIMPFSNTASCNADKWREIFDHIVKPAVEESGFGYECARYCLGRASIVKDILEDLNRALLVIADLTDNNANVMWELGVRHTLKRRTILIAQDKKFLPSDLKDYPIIVYNQTKAGFDKFKVELKAKLDDIEKNPDKVDSPIAEFLGIKNIDLLNYEKTVHLRKLDALISELSWNANMLDSIIKIEGLTNRRLQDICIKLVLSTRYISLNKRDVLPLISVLSMIQDINQSLNNNDIQDVNKFKVCKDFLLDILCLIAKIRNDYATNNYQEEESVIIYFDTGHKKYLE